MKHFQTFDDVFNVAKKINELSMESYTEHVSITKGHSHGKISVILNSPSKSKIIYTVKNNLNFYNTRASFEANSHRSFYGSVNQGLLNNALQIGGFGKTEFYQLGFDEKRYFPKGKYSANIRYRNNKITNSYFGFCVYSDMSTSFLLSLSVPRHNIYTKITYTEMSSYFTMSYYLKNSIMCYLKFNTSTPHLQNGEIGYMKEWNNNSATYMLLNPIKRQFLFGGVSYYSQKLSFAFQSRVNLKRKKKFDLQAGVKLSSETDLRLRLKEENKIDIFSQFKPRDWLMVTIRSRLSFDSVSFGWSLDFQK